MEKISIGLPVFNGAKYLASSIESILNQTYDFFELIICDNHSTDGTREICETYKKLDKRIIYIQNSKNIGAVENYNKVFHLSTGQYFKWSAHDDLLEKNFVKKCYAALEANKDAVLSYTYSKIIDKNNKIIEEHINKTSTHKNNPSDRIDSLIKFGQKFYEVFGLIRKEPMMKTDLIKPFARGDGIFLIQLSLLGRFIQIPEFLFFPRKHDEQSMVMAKNFRKYAEWFNPSLKKKRNYPLLRMHLEYFRSIRKSPLKTKEKLKCYGITIKYLQKRHRSLLRDALYYVRSKNHRNHS